MKFNLIEYHCHQILQKLIPRINIAIDGHSSCGKGTLAKHLAKELGYLFIDSGAMYRAVTYFLQKHNFSVGELKSNKNILKAIQISFKYNQRTDFFETYINHDLVENDLRTPNVANAVRQISGIKEVKDFLILQQRGYAKNKGVVMDGRDIGVNIMPDAELKIFMTADPIIRARRRFLELEQKQIPTSFEEVIETIIKRDSLDNEISENSMIKADDAIILDNTNMGIDEQTRVALSWARGVMAALR